MAKSEQASKAPNGGDAEQPGVENALLGGIWAAGAAAVAVSLGLQLTLASCLISTWTKRQASILATLTDAGRAVMAPERDLEVFASGVIWTLALLLALAMWRRRRTRASGPGDAHGGAWLGIVAAAGLACFGFTYRTVRPLEVAEFGKTFLAIVLLCPAVLTALSAALAARVAAVLKAKPSITRRWWLHALVFTVIVLVVHIPGYRWQAGHVIWSDLSHHWDHFVMGPAVGYLHGRALGADLYSQYGMGWPVLFATLSPLLPLNYGNLYLCAVVYGCIYYCALYLLLLVWIRRAGWAATGTFLVLVMQLWWGTIGRMTWTYPSSTILRAPVDVWVLLALLLYLRRPQTWRAVVSGALVGLALFFATDTGLHLALAWGAHWLIATWMTWARAGKQGAICEMRRASLGAAAALAVAFAGFYIGSRGGVLHRAFWAGWLEAIRVTRAGLGLIPLTKVDAATMAMFVGLLIVYFTSLGWVATRICQRRPRSEDALQGMLAIYGLLCLQLFVGRSVAANLYHVIMPAAVTLTIMGAQVARDLQALIARSAMPEPARERWQAARCGAFGMLAIVGLGLAAQLSDPAGYENLLWRMKSQKALKERRGAPLYPKLGVVLPRDKTEDSPLIGEKIRRIRAAGKTVAVLDYSDTRYYLVGGCAPWGRYSPLTPALMLKSQLHELESDLVKKHPDYVIIKKSRDEARIGPDVWQAIHRVLDTRYRVEEEAAAFQFWRWKSQ